MHLFKGFLLAVFGMFVLIHCGGGDGDAPSAASGKVADQNKSIPWNGDANVGEIAKCIVGDYSTEDKVDPELWGWTSDDEEIPITIHVRANNVKGSLLFVAREKAGENRAFCTEFSNIKEFLVSVTKRRVLDISSSVGATIVHSGAIGDADAGFSSVKVGIKGDDMNLSFANPVSSAVSIGSALVDNAASVVNDDVLDDCKQGGKNITLKLQERNSPSTFAGEKSGSMSGNYESLLNDCSKSKKQS